MKLGVEDFNGEVFTYALELASYSIELVPPKKFGL